jgi:hypothetical protein
VSYHGDYHWFDFDDHHLDMMCPMTDLDKQIAKYGAEAVLNKGKKQKMTDKKYPDLMMVAEHGLELTADPFRMKLISEAISDYVTEHQLEDDTTLNDFRYKLETAYQRYHNLDENDWAYIEEDREKVFGVF